MLILKEETQKSEWKQLSEFSPGDVVEAVDLSEDYSDKGFFIVFVTDRGTHGVSLSGGWVDGYAHWRYRKVPDGTTFVVGGEA